MPGDSGKNREYIEGLIEGDFLIGWRFNSIPPSLREQVLSAAETMLNLQGETREFITETVREVLDLEGTPIGGSVTSFLSEVAKKVREQIPSGHIPFGPPDAR